MLRPPDRCHSFPGSCTPRARLAGLSRLISTLRMLTGHVYWPALTMARALPSVHCTCAATALLEALLKQRLQRVQPKTATVCVLNMTKLP